MDPLNLSLATSLTRIPSDTFLSSSTAATLSRTFALATLQVMVNDFEELSKVIIVNITNATKIKFCREKRPRNLKRTTTSSLTEVARNKHYKFLNS